MAYSNGYNLTTVLSKLFGRLAWSTDTTLNTANKTSASGRYFDDGSFHSLITVPIIKAIVAEPVSPATWDSVFTAKQNAVIAKALNAVFSIPEFKEQSLLYERDDEIEDVVVNEGRAVGYRVKLAKKFDISVQINSLELYFDQAKTFNVYLYKQGSKTPVQTKSVTTVANQKTTIALTDWILNYKESAVYWVVYFQDDLDTAQAIQEFACFHETHYFGADPFTAETDVHDFDRVSPSYTVSQPNGLNMLVSSFKDFTLNISNQPHLFDELIGLIMAYQVIDDILYSIRSNGTERISKDQMDKIGMQLDLNGAAAISDGPKVVGLKQRIDQETARVRQAFYPKPKAMTVNLNEWQQY